MKFLYIILFITATFCYDSELLNNPAIFKAKYEMFDDIKKEIYSNPMPVNYKDYLVRFGSTINFFFDIIPIANWKQEASKLLLLADSEKEKSEVSNMIENALLSETSGLSDGDFGNDYKAGSYYFTYLLKFNTQIITISKGKFIMFCFMKVFTAAIPKIESGNVKVCTTTDSIFKKCAEYEMYQAIKVTDKAYAYSRIKEKMDFYN